MTLRAAFPLEDLLATNRERAKLIWVGGWLEGINVQRQGVQLFVAVAPSDSDGVGGIRQLIPITKIGWNEAVVLARSSAP